MIAWHRIELDGLRFAFWEEVLAPVVELQVFAPRSLVGLGIVVLDEGTGSAHQEEFHQFLPVIEAAALLESLDATDEHLAMLLQESTVAT